MVSVAGQVLSSLLTLTALFDALDRYLKRAAPRAMPDSLAGQGEEEEEADLTSYHPVLQELYALRKRHEETKTPSLFVEHSKVGRKLAKVEAQWANDVLPNMEPQERARHVSLIKNGFRAAGRRPEPIPRPISAMLNVPVVTGHRRWLPTVRLIVMYLVFKQIVGWSASLSHIPMLTVPSAVFWPWMRSGTGKVLFPLSWLVSRVDSAAYVDADQFAGSIPKIPRCSSPMQGGTSCAPSSAPLRAASAKPSPPTC